ncbi:DNA-binding MarR family transcriptional regulator [Actinoalloteichus hoggarensis]|uniref:Uncharacterized protein n=1 Tax=Actinoalloteichus hoggarensis TaxID=1470176 RepID=A0A221W333_9PSEU|nr:hypothetical protein [Actinoalloteichus hoggarensis]ASO20232.1 hypothetical protein AHOG_12945 [Actinoalloteichus hoggarensis]MBB5919054.1 DNA-binding MarR family transcriptional regulator [Actinoalloteichus hoggarensis]
MPDDTTPTPTSAFSHRTAFVPADDRIADRRPDSTAETRSSPPAGGDADAGRGPAAGPASEVHGDPPPSGVDAHARRATRSGTGGSGRLRLQAAPRIHPSVPTRLPAQAPAPVSTTSAPVTGGSPGSAPSGRGAAGGEPVTPAGATPGHTDSAEPWLVWEALLAAVQRWTVQPAEALRHAHGITVYDYRLLRLHARASHPMRKAIANTALDLPPRGLDHSVARLVERGYVTVQGVRAARRLALTPAGGAFLIEVVETLRAVTAPSLTGTALRPSERAALVALLGRLRN